MLSEHLLSDADCQSNTFASHCRAVERVILSMRERFKEPWSLQDLAEIALMSPYHFNRVFHQITGIPPGKFLSAFRMEAAKRLILTTPLSVTEVCLEVGYHSLGTFSMHFTQLVGLPPRELRRLAAETAMPRMDSLFDRDENLIELAPSKRDLTGRISAPQPFAGLIFVGLFATPIPQSRPLGCTLMSAPGPYHIASLPDGCYYVFAAAFPWSEDPLAYLLYDKTALYVGVGPRPVVVRSGSVGGQADVMLRPARLVDPPLLVALPSLLAAYRAVNGIVNDSKPQAVAGFR